ncbi:hypothetical protein FRB95_001831 [Tulasnella sp. JGI-2019a]|nr:hypothetical protein FRB95_001831 [Tulasnella sp. JGI-2019a]
MAFFRPSSSSKHPFLPIEIPEGTKRPSLWKRLTQKFLYNDKEDLDGALYNADDIEVRYDEEGRPYRRMLDEHGCLIHYYYEAVPEPGQPLQPQPTSRSSFQQQAPLLQPQPTSRSSFQNAPLLQPQPTGRSFFQPAQPLPLQPQVTARSASSRHPTVHTPYPRYNQISNTGTPIPVQTNPWAASSDVGGTVLDEIQMCYLSTGIQFHPLLSYVQGGRVSIVFDVRRPIADIYAHGAMDGIVSLDDLATAPRISCLKIVFQYSSELLTLRNPNGVTIGQVISSISNLAKTNFAQASFNALDDETKQSFALSYHRNSPLHQAFSEPEIKVYDTFLDQVYFSGLLRDEEVAEERVGWRDPTVVLACLGDGGMIAASTADIHVHQTLAASFQ